MTHVSVTCFGNTRLATDAATGLTRLRAQAKVGDSALGAVETRTVPQIGNQPGDGLVSQARYAVEQVTPATQLVVAVDVLLNAFPELFDLKFDECQMAFDPFTHAGVSDGQPIGFMGYDKRTALGAGAIQTVAGGLSFRTTSAGERGYGTAHRVRMNLGAPIPSLSPAGFAAAGALMLLAVGYALRRRLH